MLSAILLAPSPLFAAGTASKTSQHDQEGRIKTIRALLDNGKPQLAERNAYVLLKSGHIDDRQRRDLLRIIALGEEMRSAAHDYSDAGKAISAWKNLLKEFVSPDDAAGIRWKISWLYWKMGDNDGAVRSAEELLRKSPSSKQASQAYLLLARINISINKLDNARNDLMKFMIGTSSDTTQAEGLAWTSVIDFRQGRSDAAYSDISKAIALAPDIASTDVILYSTYVRLLYARKDVAAFQKQAKHFLNLYLDRPQAPRIQLLVADSLKAQGKNKKAEKTYELLSVTDPETTIGRKAFMRKLMLKYADASDLDTLKPVLASLHKLGVNNQMSEIEDESMLDQARLWTRLAGKADHASEKALDLYAQVSVGLIPRFAADAKTEGYDLFIKHISTSLAAGKPLPPIVLWRRYSDLRKPPHPLEGDDLKAYRNVVLGVARSMRSLMDFDSAEALLSRLYKNSADNVEGDRIMLEMARLWLDRHDPDAYSKIMKWLNAHTFTLYRPEMLLVASRVQLQNHHPNQAAQTLGQVAEADITPDLRPDYWMCKAQIAEALAEWHVAATAWRKHIALLSKVPAATTLRLADALFMDGEYDAAQQAYMQIPEGARDNRWQYQMAVCEQKTGQWAQAEERLKALLKNPKAADYAVRARLLLSEQEAVSLMRSF